MKTIYLVYPYRESERPLAAFGTRGDTERFARHAEWVFHRGPDDKCPIKAVPWFGGDHDEYPPYLNTQEPPLYVEHPDDGLWTPDEDGGGRDEGIPF